LGGGRYRRRTPVGQPQLKPAARQSLEQPHLERHRSSIEAVAQRAAPRGLHRLMVWFLGEWQAEVPSRLHKSGTWHDFVALTEERSSVGGSLLGTPQSAEGFRRYIEGSPFETDPDGRYVRPIHAAIGRLCGRQGHEGETHKLQPAPFMARFLFRLAMTGDLVQAGTSMGIPPQVQPIYGEQALYRLWKAYEVGPGAMERVA
jgi:hypothetical protein